MDKTKWFSYYYKEFSKIQQETISNHEDQLESLFTTITEEVGEKNSKFQNKLRKLGLDKSHSLLQLRILEYIFVQLNSFIYNVSSGLYDQVIRELRFLLESWALAYFIDHRYPLETLEEKINKNENNLRAEYLFRRALSYSVTENKSKTKNKDVNKICKQFIKSYTKLSKIVHATRKELERFDKQTKGDKFLETMLFYREEKVNLCIEYLEEVHELLMILLI